ARERILEDPRAVRTEPASGNDQHTPTSGIARPADESGERLISLGLCHSMQIETCLNSVQSTLQPLGICPIYPGKSVKCRRWTRRAPTLLLSSCWARFRW